MLSNLFLGFLIPKMGIIRVISACLLILYWAGNSKQCKLPGRDKNGPEALLNQTVVWKLGWWRGERWPEMLVVQTRALEVSERRQIQKTWR